MTDSQYTHTDTKKIKTANVANWLENIEPKQKKKRTNQEKKDSLNRPNNEKKDFVSV